MTKETFENIINDEIKKAPKEWRKGQAVFNIIDSLFDVARYVQFNNHIDCFYDDSKISEFIDTSYEVLQEFLLAKENNAKMNNKYNNK